MDYQAFINATYFYGELTIGQNGALEVSDELMLFVNKYEPLFLLQLMGKSLYEAFYTGMQAQNPEQRWLDIAHGKHFTLDALKVKYTVKYCNQYKILVVPDSNSITDGMPVNWRGLLQKPDGSQTVTFLGAGFGSYSPIANFIYWHWMTDHETTTGGAGEVKLKVHNAGNATAESKMIRAWNEMAEQVPLFYLLIDQYRSSYPEFDLKDETRMVIERINPYRYFVL